MPGPVGGLGLKVGAVYTTLCTGDTVASVMHWQGLGPGTACLQRGWTEASLCPAGPRVPGPTARVQLQRPRLGRVNQGALGGGGGRRGWWLENRGAWMVVREELAPGSIRFPGGRGS